MTRYAFFRVQGAVPTVLFHPGCRPLCGTFGAQCIFSFSVELVDDSHGGGHLWDVECAHRTNPHQPTQAIHHWMARTLPYHRRTSSVVFAVTTNRTYAFPGAGYSIWWTNSQNYD